MEHEETPSLAAWLDAQAARDSACLLDGGMPVSWAELARRSRCVATGLAELGVGAGDRVGVWLPNGAAWLATFLACARLGAIAVAINTRFRSAEVGDLLRRSGASVLVFWPAYKGFDFPGTLAQCSAEELQSLRHVFLYSEDASSEPATVAGKPASSFTRLLARPELAEGAGTADAPCVIFTTSGTTRAPKMVLHSQGQLLRHARNVARQYGLGPDKRFLLVPPLCGVFGFCSALAALVGDSLLVMEATWSGQRSADLVQEHRITHLTAADGALAQLLQAQPDAQAFRSLQLVLWAHFDPAHARLPALAAERGVPVLGLYGSSELQALFSRRDPELAPHERVLAGGTPASSMARVRARDTATGELCAPGQPGELEFLAPESRFLGYFEDPEATQAAFTADGWFRSGDLGQVDDASGATFTWLARMGDTLRLGGFLVSPAEIEAAVQEHPAIEACQVVGARDGDAVRAVAFVTLRQGQAFEEHEVVAHVAGRLAKYKVPTRVVALDVFPTTDGANGTKVQKAKLRAMAETLFS